MKAIINGKMYNTDTATLIMSIIARDSNGSDSGDNDLMITKSGHFFEAQDSNGQDCYRGNYIIDLTKEEALEFIDGHLLTTDQETLINKYLFNDNQ
ncbi:MAG: hypothetical protein V3R78_12590 [Thermodesulfobacteriota bacterium]